MRAPLTGAGLVCGRVAKWYGRESVAVAAVGDDAALSVFTQLAGNAGDGGAALKCGGSRGESRTRITHHLKLGGRFV